MTSIQEALVRSVGFFQPETFEAALEFVYGEMKEIMLRKREMRGTGNIVQQGLPGVVARLDKDKLERIRRHVKVMQFRELAKEFLTQREINERVPLPMSTDGDGIVDDLHDVANYAVIGVLLERGWWELPADVTKVP